MKSARIVRILWTRMRWARVTSWWGEQAWQGQVLSTRTKRKWWARVDIAQRHWCTGVLLSSQKVPPPLDWIYFKQKNRYDAVDRKSRENVQYRLSLKPNLKAKNISLQEDNNRMFQIQEL